MAFLHRQRQEKEGGDTDVCKPKKEKRRPRDKVLRDVHVGKKAMEIRKKKAFFGYTYRRPKPLMLDLTCRAVGGRKSSRPTILPVDGSVDV